MSLSRSEIPGDDVQAMKNLIGGFAFSASSFLLAAPAHSDDRMNGSGSAPGKGNKKKQ